MKRIIFLVTLTFVLSLARGQGFHYTPANYPIPDNLEIKWSPVTPAGQVHVPLTWWQKNKKSILVSGIQMAGVVFDGMGDAVYDMGKESHNSAQMTTGHTLQALAAGGMATATAVLVWDGNIWDGVRFGVGYLGARYALMDLSYNLTRGIDPLYADGWKARMHPTERALTQGFAFGFNILFNLTEF